MTSCPSCSFTSDSSKPYCIRCGFSLSSKTLWIGPARATFSWALRRSLAGFAAGWIGWMIIPAASRAAGASFSQGAHLFMTSVLGGIFLGTVEGMLEDSTLKTLRGALAGILGGLVGGLVASWVAGGGPPDPTKGILAVTLAWAFVGASIGILSAVLEPERSRMVMAGAAGFLGGAMGGWLGYQMYGSLTDIFSTESWVIKRLMESMTGAIVGAVLWFIVGLAEKLFVLKRRPLKDATQKECELCDEASPLNAWYCGGCGAILQVSAPASMLHLSKNEALSRIVGALRYAARLSATTSAVAAILSAIFLGSINVFLGLFGLLIAALLGYILAIAFNALAEWLRPSL